MEPPLALRRVAQRNAYREPSQPDGWVPFAIDAAAAADAVARTLATERSVPAAFRTTAKLVELEAVWVPAWLSHARLTGSWQAERGDERAGLEGAPTTDGEFNWASVSGTFDEALVLVTAARIADAPPFVSVDAEKAAVSLRDEPTSDALRLEPEVSEQTAVSSLESSASIEASRLASDRCGGDRQREVTTSEHVELASVRRIWVPCYRGTYRFQDETHALWVNAETPQGLVWLKSKPSDAAEVAARDALNAANRKASERQTNRIVIIALAPFAFIVLFYLVSTLVAALFR